MGEHKADLNQAEKGLTVVVEAVIVWLPIAGLSHLLPSTFHLFGPPKLWEHTLRLHQVEKRPMVVFKASGDVVLSLRNRC